MNRIKTMGLVVVAALALTALLGAASASASQFRAEGYPTAIAGTQGTAQKLVFGPGGAVSKCSTIATSGTASAASSALSQATTYKGCTLGGLSATVSANSCTSTLHSTNEAAPYTGTMDIACGKAGDAIEITQGTCVIQIPAQSSLAGVEFTNAGTKSSRTITVTYNISGLSYTGGSGCAKSLVGAFSNGTLTGSSTLKGSVGQRAVGVYLANEQIDDPAGFKAGKYSAIVDHVSTTAFKIVYLGTTLKCNTNVGTGTLAGPSFQLDQSMSFAGCAAGGIEFAVNMNGCYFTPYVSTVSGATATGGIAVRCASPGQEITLKPPIGCQLRIPAQNPGGTVGYANTEFGGVPVVQANIAVSGLQYTAEGCGSAGSYSDGSLSTDWRLSAYVDNGGSKGAQTAFWIG